MGRLGNSATQLTQAANLMATNKIAKQGQQASSPVRDEEFVQLLRQVAFELNAQNKMRWVTLTEEQREEYRQLP